MSNIISHVGKFQATLYPQLASRSAYEALGLGNEYSQSLALTCTTQIIGAAAGSILNADAQELIDYLEDRTTTLSEPFSCIQGTIDVFKTMANTFINSFTNGLSFDISNFSFDF